MLWTVSSKERTAVSLAYVLRATKPAVAPARAKPTGPVKVDAKVPNELTSPLPPPIAVPTLPKVPVLRATKPAVAPARAKPTGPVKVDAKVPNELTSPLPPPIAVPTLPKVPPKV